MASKVCVRCHSPFDGRTDAKLCTNCRTIAAICQRCGKAFSRRIYPSYYLKHGDPRFCSTQCRNTANAQVKAIDMAACLICGTEFKPYPRKNGTRQEFCSAQCAVQARTGCDKPLSELYRAVIDRYPTEGADLLAQEYGRAKPTIQGIAYRLSIKLDARINPRKGSNPARPFLCEGCGEVFLRIWYPSRNKPQYCSSACRNTKRCITCETCGKTFFRPPSRTTAKYCSRKCSGIGNRTPERECVFCGKSYKPSSNNVGHCSLQCSANAKKTTRLHKTCEWCGKEFIVRKGYIHARFCSMTCSANGIALHGPDNPNWRGGNNGWRGENWDEQSKKARQQDNHTCQHCELEQGETALPVHHIVPYRYFFGDWLAANQLFNLITLCGECHSKADTAFRIREKETGRFTHWPTEPSEAVLELRDQLLAQIGIRKP